MSDGLNWLRAEVATVAALLASLPAEEVLMRGGLEDRLDGLRDELALSEAKLMPGGDEAGYKNVTTLGLSTTPGVARSTVARWESGGREIPGPVLLLARMLAATTPAPPNDP